MAVDDDDIRMLTDDAWRAWLLRDYDAAWDALSSLHDADVVRFVAVCHTLAADEDHVVARAGLRQLGFEGERDDAQGDAIARVQLMHGPRSVREAALLALGRVGLPSTFAVIEAQVSADSPVALLSLAKQTRTAEQRSRLLEIARSLALADHGQVRIAAVRVLRGFSTVPEEEALLLKVASEYLDEVTFSALRHASPDALPQLKAIQARLREGSVQWLDVTETIAAIEHRDEQ